VNCGHCGCALVAEKKKGKYVYYHCTGNKGKCPEPYTREEVLDECFADLLKGLVFDDQVMDRIVEALHQSHADEKRFREDAITRLQEEQTKFRTALIGYTMIGLTVLSNQTSLSESRESDDRHRSDLLIKLPNTKRQQMIMCKMGIRLLELPLRTPLGKEKRPPEIIPTTFVQSGSPHWTIFATFY